jgi:hypothetical protein
MILRFWRLAPPETTKALSLARRRFCYFSGSGCWRFSRRFSAGAFDGIAGMPVSAAAAAAAAILSSMA